MIELNSHQRRFLSTKASDLKPVVMLGKEGASPQLIEALKAALADHELVKLRFINHKEERKEISQQLAEVTGAAFVRTIGNVAVFFQPAEDPEDRRFKLPD